MSGGRVVVRGGLVWLEDGPRRCDVLVEGERIQALTGVGEVGDARVVDASGLDVMPGLIDLHVHLADRIAGYQLADDFASGSAAAVLAGITTVCAFATQLPGETVTETACRWVGKVAGRSSADVHLHLTPTGDEWDWETLAGLVERGWRTFKLYTTYREAGLYTAWPRLEDVMARLAKLGVTLLLHCEDDAVLQAQSPDAVDLSHPSSHSVLRPESAEIVAISRAVDLAERTGCRLHIVHVSTAIGADTISQARARGVPVTGETGPQYLLLDRGRLAGLGGHRFLCSPPLRASETRAALERSVLAGALDVLATDHCPFRRADKDAWSGDFRAVPTGVAGLGALPALTHELLCSSLGKPLGELVERLAAAPARVAGLWPRKGVIRVGADADLVVASQAGPRVAVRSTLADVWETYPGFTSSLQIRHVLLRGFEVVVDGALADLAKAPGRALSLV